jgi:hypothetical protein
VKLYELCRIKVSTDTIQNNLRLLRKVERRERLVVNNQLLLEAPSLICIKQVVRQTRNT